MRNTLILVFAVILFGSCVSWKKTLSSQGSLDDVVNNVIIDFLHTSNLSKKDSVFDIGIVDKGDYLIIAIGEGATSNKFYPNSREIVGTYDKFFPNKYALHNGKLFYWKDPNGVITEEIITILTKYNRVDFDWREEYDLPPYVHYDGGEGIDYYICKNDFTHYKKTKSYTIAQLYKKPKLKCK